MLRRMMGREAQLLWALGLAGTAMLVAAEPVRANGCETREATRAEKDFELATKTAIKNALPSAPAGWEMSSQDTVAAEDRVCIGHEKEPARVSFRASYWQREGLEQREQELMQALMRSQPTPEQLAKLEKMANLRQEQGQKLAALVQKAVERKDFKEVERLTREHEPRDVAIEKQIEALNQEMDKAREQGTEKYLLRDSKAEISVEVNWFDARTGQLVSAPGAAAALREQEGQRRGEDWLEGVTTFFLGNWRVTRDKSGMAEASVMPNKSLSHTKVQTVFILIEADRERANQLIKQMNLKALQALLK